MHGGVVQQAKGNLPNELTSFVGRDDELKAISQALPRSRLVTLVGPGGVGKTRLAIRSADRVRRAFPDGTWLVDLGTLRDAGLLAEHVAASLGLRDESGRWLLATLSDHLARRHLLIVLDNCEHLLDSCAVMVRALLQRGAALRILATSREPLGLTAETIVHVPPLQIDGPAVELLAARASSVRSEFHLTDATRPVALELCSRLDGIPLAIELAAARLRGMALPEVLSRLDDRFSLLTLGDRSAPARQHTLLATLDWSHDLLSDEERVLWRRLAVFTGSFDLAAAADVCADEVLPPDRAEDALTHLAERSIVQFDDALVGRYRLLETVREYASAKAIAAGELDELLERHRAYYLDLAMQAVAHWASGDQISWFRRLSTEYDNLRQALEHSRGSATAAEVALGVASRLWIWWQVAGRIGEGRRWITTLRDAAPADAPAHRWALFAAGFLALSQRDIDLAESFLNGARDAARDTGDEEIDAYACGYLALVSLFRGEYADAAVMFDDAVELHRRGGRRGMAAFHLADRAIASTLAGDADAAVGGFDESLAESRAIGDIWTESHALWGLGLARLSQGDADAAHEAMRSSLALIRDVGDATGVALALEGLALTTAAKGNAERAAWLSGLADAFWDAIPASPPEPVVVMRGAGLDGARAELGDQRYAEAVDRGRATDPTRAVANALGERDKGHRPEASERPDLTRREKEVAQLVSQGLSNREIAERLVLSPRTVESHVERIMNRLGLNSRTEIAAWLARKQADATQPREIP